MAQSLKSDLSRLLAELDDQGLAVGLLLERWGARGHALLGLMLSLPFLLPVPLPGVGTVAGIIIFLSGLGIALDRAPWLPRSIRQHHLKRSELEPIIQRLNPLLKRLERWLKPRWPRFVQGPKARRAQGALVAFAGLLLALPAPPGGNVIPAIAIAGFAMSILEQDGIAFVVAVFFLLVSIAYFTGLLLAIGWGVNYFV